MSTPRLPRVSTGAAFAALIALIGGLTLNGLWQLRTLGEHMRTVVEHHNRKIDLITQTQVAAHVRTDSLFHMALEPDPFERDTHFLAFNRAGFQVGSGRKALSELGFSRDEHAYFEAQTRLVEHIQAQQENVIDLLMAERRAEAHKMLVTRVIPIQDRFNAQLADMRARYHAANLAAQSQAQASYRQTLLLTLGLGLGAVLLALGIAWHTLRQTRLYRAQIHAQLSEREQSRAALREEATHDPLTGLANRRLFYDRLQQAIRHAQRYGGHLGLLYVDVDRFKTINDVHGHHVGDNVLVEVSRQLKSCVRDSDTVARLGGDEFVILLEGVQGRQDCIAAAQKIEEALASNALFNEWQIDVEASIGQSLYPADGSDEDSLIRAADAAMYRMKSGGTSRQQTALPF